MVPSGIVRSVMKVKPSVQEEGDVGDAKEMMVGMIVGGSGSSFGVGGMAVTSFAGGMYGVGVRSGVHAGTRKMIAIQNSEMQVALIRFTVSQKSQGHDILRAPESILFFSRGFINFIIHVQLHEYVAFQCFLADEVLDLQCQVGILAQVLLGVFTTLSKANIAVRVERATLIYDLELDRQIDQVADL